MTLFSDAWTGFTSWWATIDWGNAPEWAAAILTSASLFLAVYILAQDRKNQRQAEVKKVVIRERVLTTMDTVELEVVIYNANDHPLPIVTLDHWGGMIWHHKVFKTADGSIVIPPATEGIVKFPWTLQGDFRKTLADKNVLLHITDSQGKSWYKGMQTKRIRRDLLVHIWMDRGRWLRIKERFRVKFQQGKPPSK